MSCFVGVMLRNCCPLFAAFVLASLAGCGEGSGGSSVQGRVTFQDQPLAGGTLMFYSAEGRPTTVGIAEDGGYECSLPAGEYRVTVAVGVKLPEGWKEGDPYPRPTIVLPPIYASRVKTPLTATVSAEQAEPLDFKLN